MVLLQVDRVDVDGLTALALTKLDVLDSYKTIKVAIGYELNGRRLSYFPSNNCQDLKVLYEEFPGWQEETSSCKKLKELPKNARKFVQALEKFCGVPIHWLSIGPDRRNTIQLK